LITAHYDNLKTPGYQGALDNSASVAMQLNTIQNCKEILGSKNVASLFTTLEEQGFMGAQEFLLYSKNHNFNIKKVLCLDGIGRGELSAMNNCMGSFGFKFRDYFFKEKLFTGTKFKDCPEYSKVDKSIIDLNKYNIKILHSFLSSTDGRVFLRDGIPTIHLTSSDITHFLKVMHTNRDRIDGLQYKFLKQCQEILCDIVRNI
jgi:Zn-dependent M28 family amino/carboxypeptidase